MAKYLVETYYTCSFKVSHYLDDINEENLNNLEKNDDGKFEIIDVKLDNRKTKNLQDTKSNKVEVVSQPISNKDIKSSSKSKLIDENFKKIFIWWNQYTFGTKIKTILFGKLVGEDNSGNKYYESKSGKRWVIYNGEVEASKIPSEWYSWMHHTGNKIENSHELDKYSWQKEHMPNQTGTENSYHPKKNKSKNASNKKYTSWKS